MNLTIRNSISGMIAAASRMESGLNDKFDNVVEINDALESIREARMTGVAILAYLDDLEFAKSSLENNGFTDQWFDSMNSNGNFLEAINVDISNLLGSNTEKCDVCMEGILSTIWSVIKRIWNWIWELIGKCVDFMKKFMSILSGDKRGIDKCVKLISLCAGADDPDSLRTKIGEIVNTAGERGGKYYDLRNLIERAEVDRCILLWLIFNYSKSFGVDFVAESKANNGSSMFDEAFAEYASKRQVNDKSSMANPVLRDLFNVIETDPSAIGEAYKLTGFNGFIPVIGAAGLKKSMSRTGINVNKGGSGEITIQLTEMPDVIPEIDYNAVYTDLKNYDIVLRATEKSMDMWQQNDSTCTKTMNSLRAWAKYAADLTTMYQNMNVDRRDPNYSDHVRKTNAFQWEARWMMETVGQMQKMINDYFKSTSACRKVVQAIYKAYPEVEKTIKTKG